MKDYEIHLNDWARIFAGDAPSAFYGELVLRAAYLFLLLLLSMRLLGKRMAAQLSRNDLTAMVSLAAAIGVPVMAQDRGLLPSTIIAALVIIITRLSARLYLTHKKKETVIIGDVSAVVEDGILKIDHMHQVRLPRERVMAELRSQGVMHLGEVKRLYMESTGDFSLVRTPDPRPGLLALPSEDEEFVNRLLEFSPTDICLQCGTPVEQPQTTAKPCPVCGSRKFTKAVQAKPE